MSHFRSNGFLIYPSKVCLRDVLKITLIIRTTALGRKWPLLNRDTSALLLPLTDRLKEYLAAVSKTGLTIVTTGKHNGPASYRTIAQEMRKIKAEMKHPEAKKYVTHGLRKNATIELYQAGCSDEMAKAITGHSSVEMLKKFGKAVRQIELARKAQTARDVFE